jgi:FixJ family two-component response regulator
VVRHGILEGHVPFLQKPFSVRDLLEKVRDVLGA